MAHDLQKWAGLLFCLWVPLFIGGCPGPSDPPMPPPDIIEDVVDTKDSDLPFPDSFNGHTVKGFDSVESVLAYATPPPTEQIKFILVHFNDPEKRIGYFLEQPFYRLHDEWYWFHLINGAPIEGYPVAPINDYSFETVEEITAYFFGSTTLPLGLKFSGERLYSPGFYKDSFDPDRFFGLGSILHFEANPLRVLPEELWLFELEFTDDLSETELSIFFESLKDVFPSEISSELRWLTRSVDQEKTGEAIAAGDGPYADKIVQYSDLVVEGVSETYNPGITAGRIFIVEKGTLSQASLLPKHIVVLDEIPDYLPPIAGIITGVPQTPLSHLNLLAQSRGTPNIYIGGVTTNLQLQDFEYFKKYVVAEFTEEGYAWKSISTSEYKEYLALQTHPSLTVEEIDLENAPYTVDLTTADLTSVPTMIPLTGGKAAQLAAFNDFPEIAIPDKPAAITIRGFTEHVAEIQDELESLFNDSEFQDDIQIRYLVLEGPDVFLEDHPDPQAGEAWITDLLESMSPESPVVGMVTAGGVREVIRNKPLDPSFEATTMDFLHNRYASFAPSQGLRFRSSSTAEDIKGFNGAGLYESHTGFLYPDEQPKKDKHQSVAWAIRETWSSYYAFEAFEEREVAGIDHFSANMGILVHARFDDPKEISNGVFTLELHEKEDGSDTTLTINAQDGALSVTNPDPGSGALPEIDVVSQEGDTTPTIERVQASTEMEPGQWILSDERLLEVHERARIFAKSWLAQRNTTLSVAKKETTLVLDFEFRHMDEGWPALLEGTPYGKRFIWKQVRTLERPVTLPSFVENYPIPGDILPYTATVDMITCTHDDFEATLVVFFTDPEIPGPFDYATTPFIAQVILTINTPIPGLPGNSGDQVVWVHSVFDHEQDMGDEESGWSITIIPDSTTAAAAGIEALSLSESGEWFITPVGESPIAGDNAPCVFTPLIITPTQFLKGLLHEEE